MKKLEFINIKENKTSRKQIKKLYYEAFPIKERLPFILLNLLAKDEIVIFEGIYDKKQFIGFIYAIYHKDIVFILYLAINPSLRGKGYGTIFNLYLIKN